MRTQAVVVGGGLAGLTAANRLLDLGCGATILEQGTQERYPCNSRYAGGFLHLAFQDVAAGPDVLRRGLLRAAEGHLSESLMGVMADNAERALSWLKSEARARFIKGGPLAWQNWLLAPPRPPSAGLVFEGRGPDLVLRNLAERLLARGGRLLRGHRAVSLRADAGRCTGVEAETPDGPRLFGAEAVVLADGGFQADAGLAGLHITPAPDRILQRNAGTGRGAALRMAAGLGADTTGLDRFYGHLISADGLTNPRLWPYPYLDDLATAGIVVDGSGRRFVDEGLGGVFVTNAVARLADPLESRVVFDAAIWNGPGRAGRMPCNPLLKLGGGRIVEAADLASLARQCLVDPDALEASVASHNRLVKGLGPAADGPRRTLASGKARPIETPPFYAVPAAAGITYTMGGLRVDEGARVVAGDGTPIGGLYAAGGSAGGFEGGPKAVYLGGLCKAVVLGLVAAEAIAADRAKERPAA